MRLDKLMIVAVAVALVGAACAGMTRTKLERGDVFVEVTNANHLDADVYVLSGGQQHRLGLVTTNGKERFRVSPSVVAPPGYLRVAADLLASNGSFVSHELSLQPGDVVRLVVQPNVRTSYVLLR
ncbi:MAG: hypothetical protein R3326_06120 [Gemmatimonadota bacterium]|nr:hypothetical protein [Gemmatimonadota bacterium]